MSEARVRVGVIGGGTMGSILMRRFAGARQVSVAGLEPRRDRHTAAGARRWYTDEYERLVRESDVIALAIKPQDFDALVPRLRAALKEARNTTDVRVRGGRGVLSIMAGVSLEELARKLGIARVMRMMPNISARYGKAPVAMAFAAGVGDEAAGVGGAERGVGDEAAAGVGDEAEGGVGDTAAGGIGDQETDARDLSFRETAYMLAERLGAPLEIDERHFDIFIALAGSGIAFILHIIHALTMGGVENGLPAEAAQQIVTRMVEGAAATLARSGRHPQELIRSICSAGGTTIAGMAALEAGGITAALMQTVRATVEKSREMTAGQ